MFPKANLNCRPWTLSVQHWVYLFNFNRDERVVYALVVNERVTEKRFVFVFDGAQKGRPGKLLSMFPLQFEAVADSNREQIKRAVAHELGFYSFLQPNVELDAAYDSGDKRQQTVHRGYYALVHITAQPDCKNGVAR